MTTGGSLDGSQQETLSDYGNSKVAHFLPFERNNYFLFFKIINIPEMNHQH